MFNYNLDFSRLENLITQYVSTNGFDNKADKLFQITEHLKSSEFYKLTDIIILSGILNVSPDYLIGISDNSEPDNDDITKLISYAACLNRDCRKSLISKAEQYLDIQNNLIDFDKAGITVKRYSHDGKLKDSSSSLTSKLSMVADNRENAYTKNDKE